MASLQYLLLSKLNLILQHLEGYLSSFMHMVFVVLRREPFQKTGHGIM